MPKVGELEIYRPQRKIAHSGYTTPYKRTISTPCPLCRHKTRLLTRMMSMGKLTKNKTRICENPKCPLYINLAKVKGWRH